MSNKTIIIALNLDLLRRAFFCFGELELFQCMDWRLLSGSYWKNHDSSQVITFSKKFGSFSMFWRMSAQMFIQISFCLGVRGLGTIFEHTFLMLNLLCTNCRTVSSSMLINLATARMLRRRFCWTISPTFSMLASVFDMLGWPGCWSSPISSLPSLILLNHHKNTIHFKQRLLPSCLPHDLEIVTVNGGESTSQYHTPLAAARFTGKRKKINSGYFIATPHSIAIKNEWSYSCTLPACVHVVDKESLLICYNIVLKNVLLWKHRLKLFVNYFQFSCFVLFGRCIWCLSYIVTFLKVT